MLFLLAAPSLAAEEGDAASQDSGKAGLELPRFGALRFGAVNLRKGPGTRYPIEWVYRRSGLPVEVINSFDTWYRIRDHEGAEGWVHKTQVKFQRRGMVTGKAHGVHEAPDDKSQVRAYLEPHVLFNIAGCAPDWCEVKGDDFKGYLRKEDFFGAYPKEAFD